MSAPVWLRRLGNDVIVVNDDGSRARAVLHGAGLWKVSSQLTGGGDPTTDPTGTILDPDDDYPWPNGPVDTLSPLRYGYRECVDFAAWRLNRDAGCYAAPWKYDWGDLRLTNGDAIGWKPDWQTHGWGVSSTPTAGWIGWYGSKAGALGHVNYVQKVNTDGTIVLEEYNWGTHPHAYNTRTEAAGSPYYPDSFLAPPPR